MPTEIDFTKPLAIVEGAARRRAVHFVGRVQTTPEAEPHYLVSVQTGEDWNPPLAIDKWGQPIREINGGSGSALRFGNGEPEKLYYTRVVPNCGNELPVSTFPRVGDNLELTFRGTLLIAAKVRDD